MGIRKRVRGKQVIETECEEVESEDRKIRWKLPLSTRPDRSPRFYSTAFALGEHASHGHVDDFFGG